jgi:hypothetical protein
VQPAPLAHTPSLAIGLLVLAALFGIGFFFVWKLQRDIESDAPATSSDVLADLERAYYEGEMDRQEFERVRASLEAAGLVDKQARRTPPRMSDADAPTPVSDPGLTGISVSSESYVTPYEESPEPEPEPEPAVAAEPTNFEPGASADGDQGPGSLEPGPIHHDGGHPASG